MVTIFSKRPFSVNFHFHKFLLISQTVLIEVFRIPKPFFPILGDNFTAWFYRDFIFSRFFAQKRGFYVFDWCEKVPRLGQKLSYGQTGPIGDSLVQGPYRVQSQPSLLNNRNSRDVPGQKSKWGKRAKFAQSVLKRVLTFGPRYSTAGRATVRPLNDQHCVWYRSAVLVLQAPKVQNRAFYVHFGLSGL